MRLTATLGAAALALAFALPAAAASADASGDAAASAPSSAAATSTTGASASASVAAGQTVKDKAGVTIGKVADVKTDAASGKQIATIQMGAESFAVDTAALAVQGDAAVINATQAEIKSKMAAH
jgi:hypothetical protein